MTSTPCIMVDLSFARRFLAGIGSAHMRPLSNVTGTPEQFAALIGTNVDGKPYVLSFQLKNGEPMDEAIIANGYLEAVDKPDAALTWWFTPNSELENQRPANLLQTERTGDVVQAALEHLRP